MNKDLRITEIEPDSKIVLSKFKFSCDEKDESIPLPLPQRLNFFLMINGRPGSGKTSLILNSSYIVSNSFLFLVHHY